MTNWIVLIVAGVLVLIITACRAGGVSEEQARQYLRQGAKVIDVRTVEEYNQQHLPGAINVPLAELKERIAQVAPDTNQVLLLHCRSGHRSGIGTETLKKMGYSKASNLGSYSRAEQILTTPDSQR